jgi:hypothetical protein
LSPGDLEEADLPVASPVPVWRGLFRFAPTVMGFNLEGTDDFIEMCSLLDRQYRSVVGRPSDFVKAMFNSCSIQRPLYANAVDLALKLERAVDCAAEARIQGSLHPFVFYFDVLHRFTEGFTYSHFRSLDWYCILLSPFLTTEMWSSEEFVSQSLTVVRRLVASPVPLCEVDTSELSAQFPAVSVVYGVPMPWDALLSPPRPASLPDLWFYHAVLGEGEAGADVGELSSASAADSS